MSEAKTEPRTRLMARRQFLTLSAGVIGGILLEGCNFSKVGQERLPQKTPLPTLPKIEGRELLGPLSELEVKQAAEKAITDYQRVLSLNFDREEVLKKIELIADLAQYQGILKSVESNYQPSNELDRPAITTSERHPSGQKIFLYKNPLKN